MSRYPVGTGKINLREAYCPNCERVQMITQRQYKCRLCDRKSIKPVEKMTLTEYLNI